jgi:hypothetical protein
MQKIAYSTLAIATPVVLQGCSEDDEQTTTPQEADCTTLSEAECTASDNGHCNWDTLVSVASSCERQEVDLTAGGFDNEACSENFGGIVAQQCENAQGVCSQESMGGQWLSIRDGTGKMNSAVLGFDEAVEYLTDSANNVIDVVFHRPGSGFIAVTGNPDDLGRGFLIAEYEGGSSPSTELLRICAQVDGADPPTCDPSGRFEFNGVVDTRSEIIVANNFDGNYVYDGEFFDGCTRKTTCGLNIQDGTCIPVENYCEQFTEDATTCPAGSAKADVGFSRHTLADGEEVEVITTAALCQYVHNIDDPVLDENGEPALDENGDAVLYTENIGCQTDADLELVQCAASPYPSEGNTQTADPYDPTTRPVIEIPDMCNLWLADDRDWNNNVSSQRGRRIFECSSGFEFSVEQNTCVDSDEITEDPVPSTNGRACTYQGSAFVLTEIAKECSLPRNFECSVVLQTVNGEESEVCSIGLNQPNSIVCAYDDGARAECTATEGSVDEDVDAGVRGSDEDDE